MSFVTALPTALATAASDLESIGSVMNAGSAAAAAATTGVLPAGGDEVSVLTATHLNTHAMLYQKIASRAAAIHAQFVETLSISAISYSDTESANAAGTS